MSNNKQLHWTQRVALIRHSLHAANRSGDWHFFKSLQANGFLDGTNHAARLAEELGDDADMVLASLDNLNSGLSYMYQDAFKSVYDSIKSNYAGSDDQASIQSSLYVDINMQRNVADMAIDKTASSALAMIQQQPLATQETAVQVWITGVTIIADCLEISLKEMNEIEGKVDDFIRLEESWDTVKASVLASVTVLKGVFCLMDTSAAQEKPTTKSNRSSIANASGSVLRRLSSAFAGPINPSRTSSVSSAAGLSHGRTSSVSSQQGPVYRTPNYVRSSVKDGCPTSLPSPATSDFERHKLETIPPTPAASTAEGRTEFFDAMDVPSADIPAVPALPELPLPSAQLANVGLIQEVF